MKKIALTPVCFPHPITFQLDDGIPRSVEAYATETLTTAPFDSGRCYLLLDEMLQNVENDCLRRGAPEPIRLASDVVAQFAPRPVLVGDLLRSPDGLKGRPIRVCLLNGAGGGLGDAIMFGPALAILAKRLRQVCDNEVTLDVLTMQPKRTAEILGMTPNVRILPFPISLADFNRYDAYADFSGMLLEPLFQNEHMTDFALSRIGLDPAAVPDNDKIPFLCLAPEPFKVTRVLAQVRSQTADRLLVAVIFRSAYTRTMPDYKAVELLRALAVFYHPIIIMPNHAESVAFIEQHGLEETVLNLSALSVDFTHFAWILRGMDAIVSVDTSAVHIGAALAVPTVGIFNSINMNTRIKYSPTVHGIQLRYTGRSCQAPCGLSKSLAFLQGRLANNQGFRMEFGYPCNEAVDRDGLLQEAMAKISSIRMDQDVDQQLEAIRQETAGRFLCHAPCWEALSAEEVVSSLALIIERLRPIIA